MFLPDPLFWCFTRRANLSTSANAKDSSQNSTRACKHCKKCTLLLSCLPASWKVCLELNCTLQSRVYSLPQRNRGASNDWLTSPGGVAGTRDEIPDTKKKKKGKGGAVGNAQGSQETNGAQSMPQMTLDMATEGSMEERDAHHAKISAGLRTESTLSYLVELPEGFGKVL